MSAEAAYLDTSAFVKLVIREPESVALRRYLAGWPRRVSALLLRTEALRAVAGADPSRLHHVRSELDRMSFVDLTRMLLDDAGILPGRLPSLDAIHVAAARSLGSTLGEVVTYDQRMGEVARAFGLRVASPR